MSLFMWIIISFGVLGALWAAYEFSTWANFGDALGIFAGMLLTGAVIATVLCWFLANWENNDYHFIASSKEHRVVALQDNQGVQGSVSGGIFFTTGYVESKQFYSWYEKNDDGSYSSHQVVDHGNVKVFEVDDDSEPRVIEQHEGLDSTTECWVLPSCWDWTEDSFWAPTQWIIYVPQGTIVRQFKLDAK